jgi:hypothetical protein
MRVSSRLGALAAHWLVLDPAPVEAEGRLTL